MGKVPAYKIHGRTACDASGKPEVSPLALFWAGSGIEFNVAVSEMYLNLEADFSYFEPWILVLVNDAVISRQMVPAGKQRICLFRNLEENQVHNIKIIKDTQAMSEDQAHCLLFHSIEVPESCVFHAVPEKALKLEFIGDSITSGEGLAGAKSEMKWISAWMTMHGNYAALTGRKLDADVRLLSQGGWGVYWSWCCNTACAMPDFYEQVCGLASGERNVRLGAARKHRFDLWQPDCVIVSLGTNDASGCMKNADGKADYNESDCFAVKESVKEFLLIIRKNNPGAYILWIYGIIGRDLQPVLEEGISEYMMMTGDKRVGLKIMPSMTMETAGSRNHPGPEVHRQCAELLASELKFLLHL